jgi:hypothetical protein
VPPRVAFVTCRHLPEPDHDAQPLKKAAAARGWHVAEPAWDDPDTDWSAFDLAVIRSTWNYPEALDEFLAWLALASSQTKLLNPVKTVRQNVHKGYLLGLEMAGVPIVPTELLYAGDPLPSVPKRDMVIKPAVSAGSWQTHRVRAGESWPSDLPPEDLLLQPYLPSVESGGEVSVIVIDGQPTHAVSKAPRFHGDDEDVRSTALTPALVAITEQAVATLDETPLYARVDVMKDGDRWLLSELELIEPSLFFFKDQSALPIFLDAIERRL